MSSIHNTNNIDTLQKMYNSQGYMDLYGGSAVLSILLVIVFFILFSYFHIQKRFSQIRREWPKYKCNPQVLPFAGLINKNPHMTAMDTTAANFNECINNVLIDITGDFLQPIYYITSGLETMVKGIVDDVQNIRKKIGSIVGNFASIDTEIMGRTLNLMMPIKLMFIKMKDMLAKTNATLITTMYSGIATYLGLKSFISVFAIFMLIPLAFCILTAAILDIFFFTAPFAVPFEIAAGIIGAVLIFVGIVEAEILRKEKE